MNGRASVADAPRYAEGGSGPEPWTDGERARQGTYLSLFSGVGGLDLAVEAFGYRCVGQVEIDEWCRSQLARHWPDVPRWGDVADLTAASYAADDLHGNGRGSVEGTATSGERSDTGAGRRLADRGGGGVDLICGGFPCQPVSHAGKRKGQADARWLWPDFARLVGELRPRVVIVENVPGLLSIDGGRAVSEVVGDLASMGYVGRHGTLRASDVGAPHRRERFFLVAYSENIGRERSGGAWNGRAGPADGADAPDTTPRGLRRGEPQGATGRAAADDQGTASDTDSGRLQERTERNGHEEARVEAPRGNDADGLGETRWGPYEPAIRRWERVMGPAPAPLDSGRLSADFVEWMQGLPHGWTEGKRNQRLKALGNAVVPQQAALALSLLGLEAVKT